MPKRRILLSTTRASAARVIMESLGKRGHEIYLIDPNPRRAGFSSKYCARSFVCPSEDDKENYVNFVLDVLRKHNIDLFIPTSDTSVEYFSEIREEIGQYTRMVLTSKDSIDLARNKDKTYRYCQQHGFAIPRTFFPSSMEEVARLAEELTYPCLAKFAKGDSDNGNRYFQKKEWLLGFYKHFVGKSAWPVLQEFVNGDVAGFLAVCDQGEILAHYMQRVEYKYSKGMPAVAYSFTDPSLLAISKRLVRALGWTGAINFDFIKGSDGEYKLMEINPRFGASTCFAYRLGIDLPFAFYCLAFGEPILSYEASYETGRMVRNIFPTEVVYCVKDRSHIPALFKNFFVPRAIIDIDWKDPELTMATIRNSFTDMGDQFVWRLKEKLAERREARKSKGNRSAAKQASAQKPG